MARVEVRINLDTSEASYEVQDVQGSECLKLTESIRNTYGVDPELKDEFFVEEATVEEG